MRWAVASVILGCGFGCAPGCGGAPARPEPAPVGNVAPQPADGQDGADAPVALTLAPAELANPAPIGCNTAVSHQDVLDVNADGHPDVRRFFATSSRGDYVQCKLSDLNFDGKWDAATIFDAGGSPVTSMFDLDFDGVVDQVTHP